MAPLLRYQLPDMSDGDPSELPPPKNGWRKKLSQAAELLRARGGSVASKLRATTFGLASRVRSREMPNTQELKGRAQVFFKSKVLPSIREFEPASVVTWANKTFQSQDANIYGKALTIVLCSYFTADLTSLVVGRFIPEPPPARMAFTSPSGMKRAKTLDDYNVIFARNLFSSKGLIPGEENPTGKGEDLGGPPIRTTLPFNLIGTLILEDEIKSLATIEDKAASQVYPVRETDEIPTKARIVKIEPRRVVFVNLSSGRREFVDLPEDTGTAPHMNVGFGAPHAGGPSIEKLSANQFAISRSEVDKSMADLNNILTQARAVPNFENGAPAGYKLFQIVPGSIYDKLGLKDGDVIAGLNGAPINDPGKAFEMLNELKTANHLELQVKREGRQSTFSYDIHP